MQGKYIDIIAFIESKYNRSWSGKSSGHAVQCLSILKLSTTVKSSVSLNQFLKKNFSTYLSYEVFA